VANGTFKLFKRVENPENVKAGAVAVNYSKIGRI
jgi:hypothetical protein